MALHSHYRQRMTSREEALNQAVRMGFTATNFQPSFTCVSLGRHAKIELYGPDQDCGQLRWVVVCKCCKNLHGFVYTSIR
jgi:hypothetical protein